MNDNLPPLPEKAQIDKHIPTGIVLRGYTAEQMQAYARAAIERQSVPAGWYVTKAEAMADAEDQAIGAAAPQPQPVDQCPLCGEDSAFTGSCGGGRDNPQALCYTAQPQPVQQPVAHCELTKAGSIAFFDGRPMVMVGPAGNECHPHPLYTSPQAAQPLTKTQRADVCVKAEAAMQRDPNLSWRDALMNETEKAHGITKGTT